MAQRVLGLMRDLFNPALRPYLGLKCNEDGIALQLSEAHQDLESSIALGQEEDGRLSLLIVGSLRLEVSGDADLVSALPKTAEALLKILRLVPAPSDRSEDSLAGILEAGAFDRAVAASFSSSLTKDGEEIDARIDWKPDGDKGTLFIEVDHSFVGEQVPSRMVQMLSLLGYVPATESNPSEVALSVLRRWIVRTINKAEEAKAAAATTSSSTGGEDQTVHTADSMAAEAPTGGGAEEAAPEVRDEPLSDPMESSYQAIAAVAPKPTKQKAKAGGRGGPAQGLITKAIEEGTWTVGCGKELSGQIPKGLAPSFKGKGPKDVKVEVGGETVTFSFTWAMGGGFWIFGKRAVTWSATQKS